MNAKIHKLIRQYAKIIGIKDPKLIERVFTRGDVHQKKRDLIAMRATVYAKKHIKPGTPYEEQQKIMEEFTKTENLKDVKWPDIKARQLGEEESVSKGGVSKPSLPVNTKS